MIELDAMSNALHGTGLLDADEVAVVRRLAVQLGRKTAKNQLLNSYYNSHRAFKDLGISVPPQLRNTKAALGWPEKAVTAIARKHVFEGFSLDGAGNPHDLDTVLDANSFDLELGQAIGAAYKHGCSFITTTRGDTGAGEPPVVVQVRSAEWATAEWDSRTRALTAFFAVTSTDDLGAVSSFVLALPGQFVNARRSAGAWQVDRQHGVPGRLGVEMLVHDPQLDRPFGRSRITREVRYLTDAAVRTLVRAEVSAEFFAAPQRYLVGASEKAFEGAAWSAFMGRIAAIDANEDGEFPELGQFSQMGMGPHLEMYRQLAQNFCSATSLPQSAVGIFADNPASAEAMQAAESALAEEAERQWMVFRPALVRTAQTMIMLRDRLHEVPDELWKLRVNHKPARYISPQAQADFTSKAVAAIPRIGETTEALRGLGYSNAQIEGMQSEWRRSAAPGILERMLAARAVNADGGEG